MAHSVEWDNLSKTVILQQYLEPASKQDMYELARKSAEMMSTVSHTVHLIVDEHNISILPGIADMKFLEALTPANQGLLIVIPREKSNKLRKRTLNRIGLDLAPNAFADLHFVKDIDEARTMLIERAEISYP